MRGGQCEKWHGSPATVKLVNPITMEEIYFCLFTVFSGIYVTLSEASCNVYSKATYIRQLKSTTQNMHKPQTIFGLVPNVRYMSPSLYVQHVSHTPVVLVSLLTNLFRLAFIINAV